MKAYLFLFLLVINFGYSSNFPYQPSDKELTSNTVLRKAALRLKEKTGLIPCGTGGQMMGQIEMLALSFDYRKPIEMEEGRKLLLTAVDTLVQTINEEEKIRPYLYHYPFEPKDVEIRIFLQNTDGSDVPVGQLTIVSIIQGTIRYKIENPQASFPRLIAFAKETYEEAVEKLREIPLP